jgi:hypothetical protein
VFGYLRDKFYLLKEAVRFVPATFCTSSEKKTA